MKIAFLAGSFLLDESTPINGTKVQMYNLARAFESLEHEVHYITLTRDRNQKKQTRVEGIQLWSIYLQNDALHWKQQVKAFEQILERIQPDGVYTRGRSICCYIAGRWAKHHDCTYVWGTNGDDSARPWKYLSSLRRSSRSPLKKWVLALPFALLDRYINQGMKSADHIINQNEVQQAETKKYLRREGIILPSYFLPASKKETANIAKENSILWLASITPNKQPEAFIDLKNNIKNTHWEFRLIGGTANLDYYSHIQVEAEKAGVEVVGEVPYWKTDEYFQKAKIFVNTSKIEGFSNTFIQAWLAGTPVFSLNSDPNNWLSAYDIGYCAKGDLQLLIEKIHFFMNNPDHLMELGKNAQAFAEEVFSAKKTLNTYTDLFKRRIDSPSKAIEFTE